MGNKRGRKGLMSRLDMDQVNPKPKEVTTMSVNKNKEEGKKELRE